MRGNARPVRTRTWPAIGIGLCGLLCAALSLSVARPLHATSLRRMPLKELVARSQKIVRGTVARIESKSDAQRRLWTLYTLEEASAAKGALTESGRLRFRCMGGDIDGRRYQVPGTPALELGDDVVVFYAPDNAVCQVMGWMQGHFRSLQSPAGHSNVFNYEDLPVVGVATEALVLGKRPAWMTRADADVRVMTQTGAARTRAYDIDTSATPGDFMFDLHALARFHQSTAPLDRPSEGTDGVLGVLPDLRPVNPLLSGVSR